MSGLNFITKEMKNRFKAESLKKKGRPKKIQT